MNTCGNPSPCLHQSNYSAGLRSRRARPGGPLPTGQRPAHSNRTEPDRASDVQRPPRGKRGRKRSDTEAPRFGRSRPTGSRPGKSLAPDVRPPGCPANRPGDRGPRSDRAAVPSRPAGPARRRHSSSASRGPRKAAGRHLRRRVPGRRPPASGARAPARPRARARPPAPAGRGPARVALTFPGGGGASAGPAVPALPVLKLSLIFKGTRRM